jgi:hypothetical protein
MLCIAFDCRHYWNWAPLSFTSCEPLTPDNAHDLGHYTTQNK